VTAKPLGVPVSDILRNDCRTVVEHRFVSVAFELSVVAPCSFNAWRHWRSMHEERHRIVVEV
jgi:hypothetical protein